MNKSKVSLGVLCAVVTATLAYNQAQPPKQVQQGLSDEVVIESSAVSPANINSATVAVSSSGLSELEQAQSTEEQSTKMIQAVKSQNDRNYLPSTHEQPADHRSASQPKHHGHEHAEQRRRPEDNSIIPPGEPKKPLPEAQGKS